MKTIIKSTALAIAFISATTLLPMRLLRETIESSKLPKPQLEFYCENIKIGSISSDLAKALSPVFQAKLEGPLDADRYKAMFSETEFSKESVELFVQILSYTHRPLKHGGPAWLQPVLRLIVQKPGLILGLVGLADMCDITHFNPELALGVAQILTKPEWYNAGQCPLPIEETEIYKKIVPLIANSSASSMVHVRKPIIIPHIAEVNSAEFSPNRRYVITTSDDGSALIFDLQTGDVLETIRHIKPVSQAFSETIRHNKPVSQAFFSPDSKYAIIASDEGTAQIFDLQAKKNIGTIQYTYQNFSVFFSPNSRYVITASNLFDAQIFDLDDLPTNQILAVATLVRLAQDQRGDQSRQNWLMRRLWPSRSKINSNGWVHKTFVELPDDIKSRLQKQFPEIDSIIGTAVQQPVEAQ